MSLPATGEIVLILLAYAWLFLLPVNYQAPSVRWSFVLAISLHHGVSLFNHYIGLPGTEGDSHTFHLNAMYAAEEDRYPDISLGTGFYEWILYVTYQVFGTSKLNGQSLSVLFSSMSLLMFLTILDVGRVSARAAAVFLILVSLLPAHLFFTSVIFREVFQLVGFAGGCAMLVRGIQARRFGYIYPAAAFLIFMGFFHHVLLAVAIMLIGCCSVVLGFASASNLRQAWIRILVAVLLIFGAGALVFFATPATEGNNYLDMLFHHDGLRNFILRYREAVDSANPRTSYGYELAGDDWLSLIWGLVVSYGIYLSGPWITEVDALIDIVPALSSTVRVGLLIVIAIFLSKGYADRSVVFLLVMFFGMTFLWSMGTTNFGQGFRHHSVTDWIPLAVVFLMYANRENTRNG